MVMVSDQDLQLIASGTVSGAYAPTLIPVKGWMLSYLFRVVNEFYPAIQPNTSRYGLRKDIVGCRIDLALGDGLIVNSRKIGNSYQIILWDELSIETIARQGVPEFGPASLSSPAVFRLWAPKGVEYEMFSLYTRYARTPGI